MSACTIQSVVSLGLLYFLVPITLVAQLAIQDSAKAARNPVANVIKLPFAESLNFDLGSFTRTSNSLQILPVIPLQITKNWLLVNYIVSNGLVYQPDVNRQVGGNTGLGDTNPTLFVTPARAQKVIWGVGPSLLVPTATNVALGQGKWALGPSVVALVQPDWGSGGVLIQNEWSIAGDRRRPQVNQMLLEYLLSYNLPKDWYLTTQPTISADWTQNSRNRWFVPFGGGVSRTFSFGKQAIDANMAIYRSIVGPENHVYPKWQINLQLTLLFPKGKPE